MRTLAVLVVGIWMVSSPWTTLILVVIALALLAIHVWGVHQGSLRATPAHWPDTRVEPRFDDGSWYEYQSEQTRLMRRVEELERDLIEALREVEALRCRNDQLLGDLRSVKATTKGGSTNPVYRRVGLHQDAPEWVVMAVRKAYRSRLHPDRHSTQLKPEAERRFKEAEEVFDQIYNQRGMVP
jgi:hypothetical protein